MHEIRLGQAMLCTACQLGDTIKAHTAYKQYKAAWQLNAACGTSPALFLAPPPSPTTSELDQQEV